MITWNLPHKKIKRDGQSGILKIFETISYIA